MTNILNLYLLYYMQFEENPYISIIKSLDVKIAQHKFSNT